MNANAFRHFYDYHFAENRKIWDSYVIPLSQEQFTQDVGYSHGSVRNQIVHLMEVDNAWFSGLRGVGFPEPLNPTDFDDRKIIRAHWAMLSKRCALILPNCRTICYSKNRSPMEKTKSLCSGKCFSMSGIMGQITARNCSEY
jgi:hypothetical protein